MKNFFTWIETIYYLGYFNPSPHRQQVGSATLPQGESDYTEIVSNIFVKFSFVSPQGESYDTASVVRFTKTKTYRGCRDSFATERFDILLNLRKQI